METTCKLVLSTEGRHPLTSRLAATTLARTKQSADIYGLYCAPFLVTLTNHLKSCRDGLTKPPSLAKRRAADATEGGPSQQQRLEQTMPMNQKTAVEHQIPANFTRVKSKVKPKTVTKPDARLQHLEDLHASTHVRESLKLSEGKKIRLDDHKPTVSVFSKTKKSDDKKRKADDEVQIKFTDTKDIQVSPLILTPEVSDAEELPETSELFAAAAAAKRLKKTPTETDYSDSEMDSLIRAVEIPEESSFPRKVCSSVIDLSSPSPPKKRYRDSSDTSLPKPKRTKLNVSLSKSSRTQEEGRHPKDKQPVSLPVLNIS